MAIATYHSQIGRLEKEILELDKKIFAEQKKSLDKEKQIGTVNRSITKNTSMSMLKSKSDQILRYQKEILSFKTKITDYEKQKRNKQQDLNRKREALRKEELAAQKKQQLALNRSINVASSSAFSNQSSNMPMEIDDMEEATSHQEDQSEHIPVFVSYSWDSEKHQEKVFEFVNFLRNNGFHAEMDAGLSQQQTAINFMKMMYKAMHDYPKIVVVLSEGYKKKADGFTGGVGTEYELMINDINDHPNKYILASFDGREDNVVPFGFKNRDIVDLSNPKEETRLFEKLMGHKRYVFAEVAKTKPVLPVHVALGAAIDIIDDPFLIHAPTARATGDVQVQGGKYKFIEFALICHFANNSPNVIEGFGYHVKFRRELDPENYYNTDADGFVTHQLGYDGKLYPKQKFDAPKLLIRIASHQVHQIVGSQISVNVYSEVGAFEKDFNIDDLIMIKPGLDHGREPVPISVDLFL